MQKKLTLTREQRDDAVQRLRGYLEEEYGESVGDLAGSLFLDFIAEHIGPHFYSNGLADAEAYVARFSDSLVADLDAAKLVPPRPGRGRAD